MCNAHNHRPGCTCGWGGETYLDDRKNTFKSLFTTFVSKSKKKEKPKDVPSTEQKLSELFDTELDNS